MKKELCDINMPELEKEFRLLELKGLSMEDVLANLERCSGQSFSSGFETQVSGVPVKGRVFFNFNDVTELYMVKGNELTPVRLPAFADSLFAFPREAWMVIRLDEAVNLIQGRYVYRKPEVGPGYWISLVQQGPVESYYLTFIRSDFEVREYLAQTGLGGYLGLSGWVKLVEELERGGRCSLATGGGPGMRVVKVEADPLKGRLKVMDRKGKEVGAAG